MFTPAGTARLAELLAEDLKGGAVIVTDGDNEPGETQTARASIADVQVDGSTVTVRATFDEQDGNFDWRARRVATSSGVIVDLEVSDMGRKAAGAVWTVEATLEVAA